MLRILFILLVLMFVFPVSSFAAAPAEVVGTVNDSNVRLRDLPSTDSKILAVVAKGQTVTVLGNDAVIYPERDKYYVWYRVRSSSAEGWMYSKYVTTDYVTKIVEKNFYVRGFTDLISIPDKIKPRYSFAVYDSDLSPAGTVGGETAVKFDPLSYAQLRSWDSTAPFGFLLQGKLIVTIPVVAGGETYLADIQDFDLFEYYSGRTRVFIRKSFKIVTIPQEENHPSRGMAILNDDRVLLQDSAGFRTLLDYEGEVTERYVDVGAINNLALSENLLMVYQSYASSPFGTEGNDFDRVTLYDISFPRLKELGRMILHDRSM